LTLRVVLKAGKYDVFCPVPGHKMLGMNVNIVVSGNHGSSGGSTTKSTTASGGSGASS
jgi:hypothetical protein